MLYVPDAGEVAIINRILEKVAGGLLAPWTLRLFSNDLTPGPGTVVGDITQVVGGGYSGAVLDKALFTVTPGTPSVAVYDEFVDFEFTGPSDAPGTIYGYYITDTNGVAFIIERFPAENVPFTNINGSLIRVMPRFTLNTVIPVIP